MSAMGSRNHAKRATGNLRKQQAIPEDSNQHKMLAFAAREDDTGARWIPAEKHTTMAGSVYLVPCVLSFARRIPAAPPIRARHDGILFYLGQDSIQHFVRSIDLWAVDRSSRTP